MSMTKDVIAAIGTFTSGHHFKIISIGSGFNLEDENGYKLSGITADFLTRTTRCCFSNDHSYPYGDW